MVSTSVKKRLDETGNNTLAEASCDPYRGIGLALRDNICGAKTNGLVINTFRRLTLVSTSVRAGHLRVTVISTSGEKGQMRVTALHTSVMKMSDESN